MCYILQVLSIEKRNITDGAQTAVLDAGFQATNWLSGRVLFCVREVLGFDTQRMLYIFLYFFVNLEQL